MIDDRATERAVIGCMLTSPEECLNPVFSAGGDVLFAHVPHKELCAVMDDLHTHGDPVDQLTVVNKLKERKTLDNVGGEATVQEIITECMSTANINYFIDILKDKYLLRRIDLMAQSAATDANKADAKPAELVEAILTQVNDIQGIIGDKPTGLTEQVREYVCQHTGIFSSTEVNRFLGVSTTVNKRKVSTILGRLIEEGLITRHGEKAGQFRTVDQTCEAIDFLHSDGTPLDIHYPLGLEELAQTMPGDIILTSGEVNSGKTAFLLGIVYHNMACMETHYFSSEMGSAEMKKRLEKFDIPLSAWKFHAWERSHNFADIIRPDALNIIDFLEVNDNGEYFKMGSYITQIHRQLKRGVAVIGIQKPTGARLCTWRSGNARKATFGGGDKP